VDSFNIGRVAFEWLDLNAPLEELFNQNVESSVGGLMGHDSINGGVGETSLGVQVGLGVFGNLLHDEALEGICAANHVLTSNDSSRGVLLATVETLRNDWSNELEDVGADSAGDDICCLNFSNSAGFILSAINGAVVVDGEFLCAVLADLSHGVGRSVLERLDERSHDIEEDDFVARVVQELGNKATANVATAKMNSFLASHGD